jgi:CheY-like chemotaxis protein
MEAKTIRTTVELAPPKNAATVLLIDDDPAILDAVTDFLQEEGFKVVSATNGVEALSVLRAGLAADAILLDVMMPVMDGWDFRATQLADRTLRDIPIVVITACGFAPETIRHQFHAYDVFAKPLELRHFLHTLRDVCGLENSEPPASNRQS